ncbi:MAG: hypothetical protein ACLTSX_11435 [Collinsella sp.]
MSNTQTTLGLFDGDELVHAWRMPTDRTAHQRRTARTPARLFPQRRPGPGLRPRHRVCRRGAAAHAQRMGGRG